MTRMCDLADEPYVLKDLERLFVSAFTSNQRDVVNMMIDKWNVTFGSLSELRYPDALRDAAQKLQLHADLELPGLQPIELADVRFPRPL